jgi:ligand-binding SRPBCC domain-containing protein
VDATVRRLEHRVIIKAPIEQVFHFHDDTQNLLRITPPNVKVTIESIGSPGLGFEARLTVTQFVIFRMRWHVRITRYEPPHSITDIQIRGPFKIWAQHRAFKEVEGGTELTDVVEYRLPFGILGRLADVLLVKREIAKMFTYRQQATKQLLEGGNTVA